MTDARSELDAATQEVELARQAGDVIRTEHAERALDAMVDRARASAPRERPDFGGGACGDQPDQHVSMSDRIRAAHYGVDPRQLPRH